MTALARALVVPDEQTWTVLGTESRRDRPPTFALGAVERVLVPATLPEPLIEPLKTCLADAPAVTPIGARTLAMPCGVTDDGGDGHRDRGEDVDDAHARGGHGDDDEHGDDDDGDHDAHGERGAHDMMAIVGGPSRDGLGMEPIRFRYGSLGTPLPPLVLWHRAGARHAPARSGRAQMLAGGAAMAAGSLGLGAIAAPLPACSTRPRC